jgi:hypothetical protein
VVAIDGTGNKRGVDTLEPATDDTDEVEDEFRSLLEGLRTTLPGVQLVTAFLLTVPLYDKYDELGRSERVAYYVAFASALLASVLLTAPSSHQRLRADDGVARRHRHHLDVAVRLTVVGSVLFAVALTAVASLVSSLVLGNPWSLAVAAGIALTLAWSWYYLPLVAFRRDT